VSGEVIFAPGETIKTLKVEVLADDVPEIEEVRNAVFFFFIIS
jgi:G-protein coupled receptor 98